MDFKEIQFEDVHWIHVTEDIVHWWAVVDVVTNPHVPQEVRNFLYS